MGTGQAEAAAHLLLHLLEDNFAVGHENFEFISLIHLIHSTSSVLCCPSLFCVSHSFLHNFVRSGLGNTTHDPGFCFACVRAREGHSGRHKTSVLKCQSLRSFQHTVKGLVAVTATAGVMFGLGVDWKVGTNAAASSADPRYKWTFRLV